MPQSLALAIVLYVSCVAVGGFCVVSVSSFTLEKESKEIELKLRLQTTMFA